VNVEEIMEQIRARIKEKRGVDYTEEQIREMAAVKLEKFLDPRGLRSDLLEQFRRIQSQAPSQAPPNYAFEANTLYDSHRAPLRWIRRLLQPLLKLFFNPNPLIQALHIQSQVNNMHAERAARDEAARRGLVDLQYEMLHNLVVETTRMGIELKNLKMRIESLTSRLEFSERRARALEGVVVYRPAAPDSRTEPDVADSARASSAPQGSESTVPAQGPGPGQRSRRRRRRRGRRGNGLPAAVVMGGGSPSGSPAGIPGIPIEGSGTGSPMPVDPTDRESGSSGQVDEPDSPGVTAESYDDPDQ
jgi:hypothetical protein